MIVRVSAGGFAATLERGLEVESSEDSKPTIDSAVPQAVKAATASAAKIIPIRINRKSTVMVRAQLADP